MKYKHYLVERFVATHLHHGEILHGHNFKCITYFNLQEEENLKKTFGEIISKLNYVHLNSMDFFKKKVPSTENIALFIFNHLKKCNNKVISVEVFETDDASGGIYQC